MLFKTVPKLRNQRQPLGRRHADDLVVAQSFHSLRIRHDGGHGKKGNRRPHVLSTTLRTSSTVRGPHPESQRGMRGRSTGDENTTLVVGTPKSSSFSNSTTDPASAFRINASPPAT